MTHDAGRPALPPQAVLYQLATGHYLSRALHVAASLDIAGRLAEGPRTAAATGTDAGALGTDAGALGRVLRLLVSVGVFGEHEDGRFALTSLGEASGVAKFARNARET